MSAEPTAIVQQREPGFEPGAHTPRTARREHAESQLEFVYRQIDATYNKRLRLATWYRRVNFGYQMSAAALSALITVITGFQTVSSDRSMVATNVVLIVSAIVTIITLAGGFYAPRELWVVIMGHCGNLEDLKARLEFEERSPDFDERRDEIADWGFKEYQKLIDAYEEKWKAIREKGK
ncbi:SLATT domain-containing protein [Variovorax soli]|uniref:SMODS and SLOG-associating 2TM effector domain-containing protein n=1 Tax=Variovorax soli TaxID=376815 RepID=A0ABU1N7R3_9BURK|nr:SLATT domain-containing protein [Variovorax soli]MDR6534479.1 hypothetical protein [Variovorax soli]